MGTEMKQLPAVKRGRKYPWEEWFNGKPWLLIGGKDFQLSAYQFRHSCFIAAASRGLRLKTRINIDADTLALQAVGTKEKPATEIAKRAAKRIAES